MAELTKAFFYDPKYLRDMCSIEDAAKLTQVSVPRLRDLARAGFAPCIFIDAEVIRFHRKDIMKWVRENLTTIQDGKKIEISLNVMDPGAADFPDIPDVLMPIASRLRSVKDNHKCPVIYFLVSENQIVYVGQSTNLFSRLMSHRADKKFDRVLFFKYPREGLTEVENAFIRFLKPKYNVSQNAECGEIHFTVLDELGIKPTLNEGAFHG